MASAPSEGLDEDSTHRLSGDIRLPGDSSIRPLLSFPFPSQMNTPKFTRGMSES